MVIYQNLEVVFICW